MASLLNDQRPPVFCPGCSHERITHTLDKAFQKMGFRGDQVVIVSDIGCSGLFDTFFHTHALHGLHGRALTYAAGLKMAQHNTIPHSKAAASDAAEVVNERTPSETIVGSGIVNLWPTYMKWL